MTLSHEKNLEQLRLCKFTFTLDFYHTFFLTKNFVADHSLETYEKENQNEATTKTKTCLLQNRNDPLF